MQSYESFLKNTASELDEFFYPPTFEEQKNHYMKPQPSLGIFSQEYFMKQAFQQALLAAEEGEVPVGAVVVSGNRIIAQTYNQVERLNDVTAHAEILALTAASEAIGNKYLMDCTLYVTLEPCLMCAGALRWSQLGKLVFAAPDDKNGFMRYGKEILHPQTKVAYGVMEEECKVLLKEFFSKLRK